MLNLSRHLRAHLLRRVRQVRRRDELRDRRFAQHLAGEVYVRVIEQGQSFLRYASVNKASISFSPSRTCIAWSTDDQVSLRIIVAEVIRSLHLRQVLRCFFLLGGRPTIPSIS